MRIHLSPKPLKKVRTIEQVNKHWKPSGLWYGIDDAWLDWCSSEMPEWVHEFKYEICLNPQANLLVLTSAEEAEKFSEEFFSPDKGQIDWSKVAELWDGLEINPYEKCWDWNYNLWHKYIWYNSWDCSSGCVWNANAIQLVRKL